MPYALSCLASVIVPAARGYKQDSGITMDVMFDFDALDEVPSLADSQPFTLARGATHWAAAAPTQLGGWGSRVAMARNHGGGN